MKSLLLASTLFTMSAYAATDLTAVSANISKNLSSLKLSVVSIAESPVQGVYEVNTGSSIIHSTGDGQYVFSGDLYQFADNGIVNLSESKRSALVKEQVRNERWDAITYKADNEKYEITVFTDTSCGYCKKLHNDMQGYNELGISIRYLAFPRGGVSSPAYKDMVSVWCASDRQAELNKANAGLSIPALDCENQVLAQYELGVKLGVKGTPAIIMPNGKLQPGYAEPAIMLKTIEQNL